MANPGIKKVEVNDAVLLYAAQKKRYPIPGTLFFYLLLPVQKHRKPILLGHYCGALDQGSGIIRKVIADIAAVLCDPFCGNCLFQITDLIHICRAIA